MSVSHGISHTMRTTQSLLSSTLLQHHRLKLESSLSFILFTEVGLLSATRIVFAAASLVRFDVVIDVLFQDN